MEEETSPSFFKKKLKKMAEYRGQGTQLISLYVPENADRSSVMNQLTEEISQSSNIKSPQTRKNVQGSLRRITNFLKQIDFKIPKKGIVIFCGNVSENEGRSDIKLFTLKPLQDLRTKLYWCDSKFHLSPLEEMVKPSEVYGLLTMDKREATVAVLIGKKYNIVGHFTSNVAGKTRAGGQCCIKGSIIQISDGELIKIEKVHNPLKVKSINFNNYSIEDSAITDKWNTKKKIYNITTKNPVLNLETSKDHVFFVLNENGIIEKPAEKLRVGEHLLMPEKIEIKGRTQKINSKKYYNSFKISEKGSNLIKKLRVKKKLSQKEFSRLLGLTQSGISSYELGKRNVKRENINKICKKLNLNLDKFIKEYTKPVSKNEIKLPLKLDEKFSKFIGYLIGDGSIEKDRITFFEKNKEVCLEYKKEFEKYFNINVSYKFRKEKNYHQLRLTNKPLVRLIKAEFSEVKKSIDSEVPSKILKSNNKIVANFLKGMFDAKGYYSASKLEIASVSKSLIQQIQMLLLRFSILSSIFEYDNKENPYSKNPIFKLQIIEKESIKNFNENISFTSKIKTKKLISSMKNKSNKSSIRQIVLSGKKVRKLIENGEYNLELFPKVNSFFRNERMMSKEIFKNSILKNVKDKKLYKKLKKIYNYNILPVKINKIEKENKKTEMIDISVKNQNFIANGIIVHNSAHRFERLREEAEYDFYKKIAEKVNHILVPYGEKLKGLIVGGPGATKNYFLNAELLDHRLKKVIIGILDAGYTDESGIRELVQKSDKILKDTDLMKERNTMKKFFEEISKDGLVAYGRKEVEEALDVGQVKTLLVSEDLESIVFKVQCVNCNEIRIVVVEKEADFKKQEKCPKCESKRYEILEEIDYPDYVLEKAQETGAKTIFISTETSEGEQFLKGFGGIGALLRYKQ